MKKIFLVVLINVLNLTLISQELILYNVDNSQFPIMNASFLAMKNKDSAYTDISINYFNISEMGIKRKVISVNCPEGEIPSSISSVLTIDVSGSMIGTRLANTIEASKLWVNMMNLPASECGIVTFSSGASIMQDLTSEKLLLIQKLNALKAMGGTNYEAALWSQQTGALNMVKRGKYKKVIVFLTDGLSTLKSYPDVIKECVDNEIVFYAITMDMLCPTPLKMIAEGTGGKWIENVKSKDQLLSIFMEILHEVQKMNPCTLVWESENFCSNPNQLVSSVNGIMNFNYENVKLNKDFSYTLNKNLLKSLKITPSAVNFGFVPIGAKKDTVIRLYAEKGDFNIFSIVSTNSDFSITPTGGNIKQGNDLYLTLTYTPSDTVYTFGNIEFRDPNCVTSLMVNGGKFNAKPKIKTIKVTHPNGGEVFAVGSDTLVNWSGITQDDIVNLDYSTDNGYSWSNVAKSVKNLKYDWQNIPNTPSNKCLMKVSQISDDEIYPIFSLGEGKTYSVKYNSLGTRVAFGGTNGITVRDPLSGRALLKIANNTGIVNSLTYSPDGKLIASAGNGFMRVWNSANGNPEKKFSLNNDFYAVDFSNNGEFLSFAGNDKAIYFYNTGDWSLHSKLDNLNLNVRDISFSPDGNFYVYTDNSQKITIREFPNHNIKKVIQYSKAVSKVEWNKKKNLIATEYFLYDIDNDKYLNEFIANSTAFAGEDSIVVAFNDNVSLYKISNGNLENRINQFVYGRSAIDYNTLLNQFSFGTDNFQTFMYNFNNMSIVRDATDYYFSDVVASASPNLEYVALNKNNLLSLWLIPADTIAKTLYYNKSTIKTVKWNASSKYLAAGSADNMLFVFDVAIMDTVFSGKSNHNSKQSIVWNKAGTHIAYTNDVEIVVVEMKFPFTKKIYKFTAYYHKDAKPIALDWSDDGNYIIATYNNFNIAIWQLEKYDEPIKTYTNFAKTYNNIMFSEDGKQIVVGSLNYLIDYASGIAREIKAGDAPTIWSFDNKHIIQSNGLNVDYFYRLGNFKESFRVHNSNVVEVSAIENSQYFLTASDDGTVKIWEPESNILQEDVSDFDWKIISPKIVAKNVDMGIIPVNNYKDSIVSGFIFNNENVVVNIDSIIISGNDKSNFEIVSGNGNSVVKPKEFLEVEFRFIADEIRKFNSDIEIYYNNTKEKVLINGEGVEESIRILPSIIDFDSVFVNEFKDSVIKAIIVNVGSKSVAVTKSEFGIPGFDNFLFSSGINDTTFTIEPGDSVRTELRFAPLTSGSKSGVLQFHHDKPGSPANVQLFGIAVPKGPKISSSASKSFNLICEDFRIDSVQIFNTGNRQLIIEKIDFTEITTDFSIIGDKGNIIIDTNDFYTLKIMFAPKTSGLKKAYLKIISNAANDTAFIMQFFGSKENNDFISDIPFFNLGNLCPSTKITFPITITNLGLQTNKFDISLPSFVDTKIKSFYLDSEKEITLEFEFLGLNTKQIIDDYIIIKDTICNKELKINITGNISESEFSVNEVIINSFVGKTSQSFLRIKNESSTEITISPVNVQLPQEITMDLNIFPLQLAVEQFEDIPISFNPKEEVNGEYYVTLSSLPCKYIDSAKIIISSSSAYCLIEVGNETAFSGEIINIPIYIKNRQNFNQLNIQSINFDLKFNSTLLEPLDFKEISISKGQRILKFESIPIIDGSDLLANVRFKAGLGNAANTELIIENPEVIDHIVHFDKINGIFDLKGICEDGGKRLIGFDSLQGGIINISPNPASEFVSIIVGFIENGYSKLSLIDISGSEIYTIFAGNLIRGTYQYEIDTKYLNSGLFFIKLETPTIMETRKLSIEK